MWLSRLKSLRVGTIVSGVANVMVVIVGGIIIFAAFPSCDGHKIFPVGIVSVAAGVKFCAMIKTGMAQEATAKTVLESAADTIIRHERRVFFFLANEVLEMFVYLCCFVQLLKNNAVVCFLAAIFWNLLRHLEIRG